MSKLAFNPTITLKHITPKAGTKIAEWPPAFQVFLRLITWDNQKREVSRLGDLAADLGLTPAAVTQALADLMGAKVLKVISQEKEADGEDWRFVYTLDQASVDSVSKFVRAQKEHLRAVKRKQDLKRPAHLEPITFEQAAYFVKEGRAVCERFHLAQPHMIERVSRAIARIGAAEVSALAHAVKEEWVDAARELAFFEAYTKRRNELFPPDDL